jgi:hypothetical protein
VITETGRRAGYRPVFILATARSYSTVTVAMLAGHPQIYGFPELVLFTTQTVGQLLAAHARAGRATPEEAARLWTHGHISGLIRAIAQLHDGSQDPDAIGRARTWLERHPGWPTTRLMDHLLDLVQPRIGLEKSPDTLGSVPALQRCVTAYPYARFIHLTRHPVTAQRSMRERLALVWSVQSKLALTVAAASQWYTGNLRAARVLADLPAERWRRVRAEDLLAEPARMLAGILHWLELDYDDRVLRLMRSPERWLYADTGPVGELFGGDPKFFGDPKLRPMAAPCPAEPDPLLELPEPVRRKITELAECLGYRV